MKSVYSYYFPEIRELISEITANYPHREFLKSVIPPGLDDYEKPIVAKMKKFYKEEVIGFENFDFVYPTAGSSEGIYHLLSRIKVQTPDRPIYTLVGEYEGYRECAAGMGMKVIEVEENMEEIKKLPLGIWFISNPSARSGNIIPNSLINQIANLGHEIVLDLAYLGMTEKHLFDLRHKNIVAVLTSMSKPFGLFYYRVGFTFAKEEVKTLYGTKWFKNILSLIIAGKVFDKFSARYLYEKYSPVKKEILEEIKIESGIEMRSSDALLLGYLTESDFEKLTEQQKKLVEPFKRGRFYRFCLTKYFLEWKNYLVNRLEREIDIKNPP